MKALALACIAGLLATVSMAFAQSEELPPPPSAEVAAPPAFESWSAPPTPAANPVEAAPEPTPAPQPMPMSAPPVESPPPMPLPAVVMEAVPSAPVYCPCNRTRITPLAESFAPTPMAMPFPVNNIGDYRHGGYGFGGYGATSFPQEPPVTGGLHERYPYYSYRRPWYTPGPASLNVTIVW